MMYCLCYVSTKRKGLLQSDIMDIIESSSKKNLNKDITGILIDYQNNFFISFYIFTYVFNNILIVVY